MHKQMVRNVKFNQGDSLLYGQNVGDYPVHHFFSQNSVLQETAYPLMVNTCGYDLMCRGVYRVRKNCNVCSFELVREGEMLYQYGEVSCSCVPGDLFILHLGSDNRMECVSDFARISCAGFTGAMLSSILDQLKLTGVPFIRLPDPVPFFQLFDRITELGRERKPENLPCLSALGYELLLLISKIEQRRQRDYPPLLENMLRFLETEFASKLKIEDLAKRFRVSKGMVFALFKRYIGYPPVECLIRIRMKHAVRLLKESEEPVKQIAAECGYEDQLYFSQQFHRLYGVSPSEFRKSGKSAIIGSDIIPARTETPCLRLCKQI